jgi:hypothetical protein
VLSQLKLVDKEEANEYVNTRSYQSKKQELYYKNILNEYIDKDRGSFKIINIDKNNRIYSILTKTPKYLKQFINLKYSLDISNSHPLLFNYYLFLKYNLNYNQFNFLNELIFNIKISIKSNLNNADTPPIPYDNDIFRKQLKNKVFKNDKTAKRIPIDVLEYIVKTSMGRFWDDFAVEFQSSGLLRGEVKTTLFREVFYSKTINTRHKRFAKAFKAQYPNVYKLINEYKPKEDRKLLSNMMMGLESEIFHKILERLYRKRGCNVLTIHDAIVMLDTKGTEKYQPDDIEQIMKQVYAEYNLNPSISIEYYSPNLWREEIEERKRNQPRIDAFIEEYRGYAADSNHKHHETAKYFIKRIDEGGYEMVIENGRMKIHRIPQ